MTFSALDIGIVLVYLTVCFGAGVYARKFVGGVADFLVAGRALGLHLGVATLAATEIGTITFMYYAELGYKSGFAPFITALISGLVFIFIGRTGFVVERLRALKLMTVPEYCQIRYSRGVRITMGILVAVGGILNMGMFLRIEGTFLTILTGIPQKYLVHTMVGILLLEMAYTILGGMLSVAITDFIQFIMLAVATLAITVAVVMSAGWGTITSAVSRSMGEAGFNPIVNSEFGWTYVLWMLLSWLAVNTVWQTTAMRAFSLETPELSRKVYTWTGFIFLGRGMFPILWGIAAFAVLGPGQDGLEAMPRYIVTVLGNGVRGLVVAGMLAATMSVNSAYLLGWSSVISQDIVAPMCKRQLSEATQLGLNRAANVFVSLFIMFWGLFYKPPGAVFFYLAITGAIFLAGTFVSVSFGLYWPRASSTGAYMAMAGGVLGAVGYLILGLPANYCGFGAFGIALVGMLIGSAIAPHREVAE
jgi:solute:Na+ symporter, SSS family